MKFIQRFLLLFLCLLLLTGCFPFSPAADPCTVLFEDTDQIRFRSQIHEIPRGSDLTVTLQVPQDLRICSVNYPDVTLSPQKGTAGNFREYELTLHHVRYSVIIRFETAPASSTLYHFSSSGGSDNTGNSMLLQEESDRLRINSLPYSDLLTRDDAAAIGWRILETGEIIGFGSRFDHSTHSQMTLEPVFLSTSPAEDFRFVLQEKGAVITRFAGQVQNDLVIPCTLGNQPVIGIASGAFDAVSAENVVFPFSLEFVEAGAFSALDVQDLYLFDDLTDVCDLSFGDLSLLRLHINAVREPVYCGSYFDTLSEKIDYLASMEGRPKIVFFCGSSARFGYDTPRFEAAFPEYKAVNLGVYAYANMLMQARLMQTYLQEGDIVLSSPEFDSISCQFCADTTFDSETFAMLESNYDMLTRLDLREFTGIFDAFRTYQEHRRSMTPRAYTDIPAHFDEDGRPAPTLSYNRQGDYILYRSSNTDRRLFGVKRASYNPDAITEADWTGLNDLYDRLTAAGIRVFFTYSPRSERSITEDSTSETIAALDAALRERLHAPVISDISTSLMDAYYFFGTDNHLTTEGVRIHTDQVIADLKAILEVTP